jgi:chromate transporter
MKKPAIIIWLKLFWMFLKINLLTTSGPASVGLLYKEAIGTIMTEAQFIEAVGFSNILPGSEALKLAMFVGFAAGGIPGTVAALLGSILPPTLIMLAVVAILQRVQGEAWMYGFIKGLGSAVAMLMVLVAWQLFRGEKGKRVGWRVLLIASLGLIALVQGIPSPLVLIGSGIIGVILFR